jgi:hypothetical protein
MHDVGFVPRALRLSQIPREMRRVAGECVRHGWQQRPVRLLMFVSFLQLGFMSWAFHAWQPDFLELLCRDAVSAAGAAASAFAGAMIAGNAVVDHLTRYCGRRTTLLLSAGVDEESRHAGELSRRPRNSSPADWYRYDAGPENPGRHLDIVNEAARERRDRARRSRRCNDGRGPDPSGRRSPVQLDPAWPIDVHDRYPDVHITSILVG